MLFIPNCHSLSSSSMISNSNTTKQNDSNHAAHCSPESNSNSFSRTNAKPSAHQSNDRAGKVLAITPRHYCTLLGNRTMLRNSMHKKYLLYPCKQTCKVAFQTSNMFKILGADIPSQFIQYRVSISFKVCHIGVQIRTDNL